MQSAILAKNLLWVANIINLFLFFSLSKILKTSLAFLISRLPVGSSASIISGELINQIDLLANENILKSNIFSRLLKSFNYLVWGDA